MAQEAGVVGVGHEYIVEVRMSRQLQTDERRARASLWRQSSPPLSAAAANGQSSSANRSTFA
jgi:hypothetical protein